MQTTLRRAALQPALLPAPLRSRCQIRPPLSDPSSSRRWTSHHSPAPSPLDFHRLSARRHHCLPLVRRRQQSLPETDMSQRPASTIDDRLPDPGRRKNLTRSYSRSTTIVAAGLKRHVERRSHCVRQSTSDPLGVNTGGIRVNTFHPAQPARPSELSWANLPQSATTES